MLAILAGCASVPADYWQPGLRVYDDAQVSVHYVKPEGIAAYCSPIATPGSANALLELRGMQACARPLAEACNIYIRGDLRGNACLLQHERRHCEGWDHPRYPSFPSIVC